MLKVVALVAATALVAGCTDAPNARRVLEANGYTNIKTDGYAWFACAQDDTVSTKFTATAPNGTTVDGAVCQGMLTKGAVIRLN